jgi:hypothetical protein
MSKIAHDPSNGSVLHSVPAQRLPRSNYCNVSPTPYPCFARSFRLFSTFSSLFFAKQGGITPVAQTPIPPAPQPSRAPTPWVPSSNFVRGSFENSPFHSVPVFRRTHPPIPPTWKARYDVVTSSTGRFAYCLRNANSWNGFSRTPPQERRFQSEITRHGNITNRSDGRGVLWVCERCGESQSGNSARHLQPDSHGDQRNAAAFGPARTHGAAISSMQAL